MKFKRNGSVLILFLMIQINQINNQIINVNSIKYFLDPSNEQSKVSIDQFNELNQQQNDKNEIMRRIEESNDYHRKMNELELEFDYFNMLTSRKKKSSTTKNENPKTDSISKDQLMPPYMFNNYQELTRDKLNNNENLNRDQSRLNEKNTEKLNQDYLNLERNGQSTSNEQFNNDQSYQLKNQYDNQFNNEQYQDTDRLDKLNNDKIINNKLNENQLINETIQSTNQSTQINETKSSTNWFLTLISKFGFKLSSSSNDNLNATINNQTAIKQKLNYSEKLNYYSDYDVMMGIRIGYSLFSLFALFTLFITYKSYCNSRKQARHRRESEKKRKTDEQGSSRRIIIQPNTSNSVRRGSGQMLKTFVKLKTNKEIESSE